MFTRTKAQWFRHLLDMAGTGYTHDFYAELEKYTEEVEMVAKLEGKLLEQARVRGDLPASGASIG
jgi:hypothetical protein